MKNEKIGLSFGKVTYLDGDDGWQDKQCIVYLNGKEVGHFYREPEMNGWAADEQLEMLFGSNELDGYTHIRAAQKEARRMFDLDPVAMLKKAQELDPQPIGPYYGPPDAPARRHGSGFPARSL